MNKETITEKVKDWYGNRFVEVGFKLLRTLHYLQEYSEEYADGGKYDEDLFDAGASIQRGVPVVKTPQVEGHFLVCRMADNSADIFFNHTDGTMHTMLISWNVRYRNEEEAIALLSERIEMHQTNSGEDAGKEIEVLEKLTELLSESLDELLSILEPCMG